MKKNRNPIYESISIIQHIENNIGQLITPMPLTEEIMRTQFYDKADEYNPLDYTNNSYKQDKF